ncbi:hypothetical protein [Alteribacillus sp. HJP-4]|uniref:hypothetical protein n=1 Tax=Alteribacillus sp. HJP-4 TaxID=2775394 RepID=UPI0035CCE2EB
MTSNDNLNDNRNLSDAIQLLKVLRQKGIYAVVAGGAVRDKILMKPPADVDIAVDAGNEELLDKCPEAFFPSNHFDSALLPFKNSVYEITPFRGNSKNLIDDLAKRDFTMNAMALNEEQSLIDPYYGRADIKAGIIRAVGNANARFQEDPLRILRAYRFMSKFGWEIEPVTLTAIQEEKHRLGDVAVERLRKEIDELLIGQYHPKSVSALQRDRIAACFPERLRGRKTLSFQNRSVSFATFSTLNEKRAAFFICLYNCEAGQFIHEWKYSNKDKKKIKLIIESGTKSKHFHTKGWGLYQIGLESALQVERFQQWITSSKDPQMLKTISAEYKKLPIKSKQELAVDGSEILRLYPEIEKSCIGTLLTKIERLVVEKRLANDKEEIIKFLKERLKT